MTDPAQCPILDDVAVVEVGGGISLAFCGRLLAALGARVVKVEPRGGDPDRRRGPFAPLDRAQDHGGLFIYLNCDKRSVTLDLESASGRDLLQRLVARAQVVLVALPPQEQDRLGLSAEALRARRPDLVVTSLTTFGASGPYRGYQGSDLTAVHWGGLAQVTPRFNTDPAQEPLRPDGYLGDFLAGLHGALASLAAIVRCDRGAEGAGIDVSSLESVLFCMLLRVAARSYAGEPGPRLSRPRMAPFHFFPCRDGRYIFIMTVEDHQWDALVELMGSPDWARADYLKDRQTRADSWEAIEPLIAEWCQQHTVEEVFRGGSALRLPCAPADTVAEFAASPQMEARGFFTDVEEPGLGRVRLPGAAVRMALTPWRLERGAPRPGEHNRAVLCEELGLSAPELAALQEAGVV